MRSLHFVGVGEDGSHLVLGEDEGAGRFEVPIDERLRAAVRGDRSRLGQIELALDSSLRPREIQARVRAGESAEEIAAGANVPLDRVLRFAYPVLAEREQVAAEARRTRIRRSEYAARLGEQVDTLLTRSGVNPDEASWDAIRNEEGRWWVTLTWRSSTRDHRAQWTFDLASRSLTPADDTAAELQAEIPRRRPGTAPPPRATVAASPSKTAAPAPADTGEADAAGNDPGTGASAAAITAARTSHPAGSALPEGTTPAPAGPRLVHPQAPESPGGQPTPERTPDPAEQPAGDAGERRSRRGRKAKVPAWDDIIFGTRGQPRGNPGQR